EELDERILATLLNPPVLDRRITDLTEAARKILAIIGLSRRATWKVGHLLTLLSALGHNEGFTPILSLLQGGLLFPVRVEGLPELVDFESVLGESGTLQASVFTHPAVAARARGEDLGLPQIPGESLPAAPRESDGLDWPLRLSVVWQDVHD